MLREFSINLYFIDIYSCLLMIFKTKRMVYFLYRDQLRPMCYFVGKTITQIDFYIQLKQYPQDGKEFLR